MGGTTAGDDFRPSQRKSLNVIRPEECRPIAPIRLGPIERLVGFVYPATERGWTRFSALVFGAILDHRRHESVRLVRNHDVGNRTAPTLFDLRVIGAITQRDDEWNDASSR